MIRETEVIYLLEHAEREIDRSIVGLNNMITIYQFPPAARHVKSVVDRLLELSLEINTRCNHLKRTAAE